MVEPIGLPEAVARLAQGRAGEAAFLGAHHVEAARRLAACFERARLCQRVTMSYDPTRVSSGGTRGGLQAEMSASAAEARSRLAQLARQMPGECWTMLFDICGLDRGLQDIEGAYNWPRRGGKLVLRIALSHLAALYGLEGEARGREAARYRTWLEVRPPMFAEATTP